MASRKSPRPYRTSISRTRLIWACTLLILTACQPTAPSPTAAPAPTTAPPKPAAPSPAVSPAASPSPAAVASPSPSPSAAEAAFNAPAGRNWPTHGGNMANQRFSSLNQINTNNVAQLKGAWTYKTGASSPATSFESTPIVIDGVMYLTGPQSQVYALNAKTGQEMWKYVPQMTGIEALPLCCGQVNRGVAVGDGKVFVGQLDAKLAALDQRTGRKVWEVQLDDPRAGYSETMAPLYHDGRVYIGISGAEYEIRGRVTAHDARDGRELWRFWTVPGPGEFGNDTWPAGTDMWKYGGGSMWQTPALDPDLGMLYIMVGNPSPDLDGSIREGDNLFTESIVALDMRTGQRKWHFQQIHHDIWDLDTVSPNILFDADVGGRRVKGLAQAGKTGWVYLLDRETGRPLLSITEKPVPQSARQKSAATQPFPDGDSFVPLNCTEPIPPYPIAGGIFTPFESDPVLICPGANGGSEWTDQSFNPQTSLMYVCGIHQPQIWTAKPEKLEQGTLRLGSAFVTPPGGKTWGTLTAIDVRTNKMAWQKSGDKDEDFKQMCIGGTMTTAGGLVFAGEGNGNFNAYDARSGQRLWQFQTAAGVNAPAITYEVDGDQYVAVASGGNFQLNFPRGDTLWVYSLKGTMGPVAAPPLPNPVQQQEALAVNNPRMVDFGYQPGWILVPPGTTVTWTQTGDQPHSATSDEQGVFDSGILTKGQTYSHQFNDEGSFDYFCIPHPFMRGKVIVSKKAPQPTQAPPPAEAPGPPREPEAAPKAPAPSQPNVTPGATPKP